METPFSHYKSMGFDQSLRLSKSSLCAQCVAKDPSFLQADSEDWSDWADAQAGLSLRWAHMPFCWFCHDAAHFHKINQIHFLWVLKMKN